MADSLHTRYMAASDTWRTHRKSCEPCADGRRRCTAGARLWDRFCDLQDTYLNHLRTR
ncbi:MAG TPA: hypothetical protein VN520_21130 [Streptomyces sp.]|uniref:hypothetical protein n=1 Tax=Streptomyces sp. TaxID=1931 RepID=UPI002B656C9A|nr:hypothetical protein [Streptomyces sp.]HWU08852.1 hypothetical protein [Streptomyces sp.]